MEKNGYYIYCMEDIPDRLPKNPTRRDIILCLRGHFDEYLFTKF